MDLKRVHMTEWLMGAAGLVVMIGLSMPWSSGDTGFQSFSLLKLILELTALAALLSPFVVALTAKSDLPIVWQLFTSMAATLGVVVLLARIVFPPEGGLEHGFFVVLGGSVLLVFAGWLSVARES